MNLEFTKESFAQLKQQYKKALKEQKQSFIFYGQELDMGYAKYLLEFLESVFPSTSKKKKG